MEVNVPFRTGIGYDSHRFAPERALILGGVRIPYHLGLQGHSDSDALAHAVIDALLGAAALPDIGRQFPDTDERYRGADSLELLARTRELLGREDWQAVNVSAVIIAQAPKLAAYIGLMRANIAEALGIDVNCVGISAKSNEGMGFTGSGEGVAAQCVCLIGKIA